MKPISLNQLLFRAKSPSLSFYQPPMGPLKDDADFQQFIDDMIMQLTLQERHELISLLKIERAKVLSILKNHPHKSHGFFFSEDVMGYVILDQKVDPYCIIGHSFHVRPLLEELLENPEYMVVNVSLYDIKIYRGDFEHIEIIQQYEFDQLPKNFFGDNTSRVYAPQYLGLIPFKTIMAIKTIAQKVMDLVLYQSMPVIVTGLEEVKNIFLRYFEHSFGVISHIQEDFYEKTCMEILDRCKNFRYMIVDFYSAQLKERLKQLVKSKRLISNIDDIIKAVQDGKVVRLILPTEKRVEKEYCGDILNELAEEVMKQGGLIKILPPHFFPHEARVLAILKG